MSDTGTTPLLDTPTLAMIAQAMNDRPIWQIRDAIPFPVDRQTWTQAEHEMREAMQLQGRDVPAAPWAPMPNFLLHGNPVVIDDAQD